jgi:hypothetical protein
MVKNSLNRKKMIRKIETIPLTIINQNTRPDKEILITPIKIVFKRVIITEKPIISHLSITTLAY